MCISNGHRMLLTGNPQTTKRGQESDRTSLIEHRRGSCKNSDLAMNLRCPEHTVEIFKRMGVAGGTSVRSGFTLNAIGHIYRNGGYLHQTSLHYQAIATNPRI